MRRGGGASKLNSGRSLKSDLRSSLSTGSFLGQWLVIEPRGACRLVVFDTPIRHAKIEISARATSFPGLSSGNEVVPRVVHRPLIKFS